AYYSDDHCEYGEDGVYFQDEYSIRKGLAIVVGLRDDWHEKYGNTLSPRVGLVFRATPRTDVRATYSWAFRAPNSFESFYSGNKSNTTKHALLPDRFRSW